MAKAESGGMDTRSDSPDELGDQWVTLERAAELLLPLMPISFSMRDAKIMLGSLAQEETLQCRDLVTKKKLVPYMPVGSNGSPLGRLKPEVEIQLGSFRQYVLRLNVAKRFGLFTSDILNIGNKGMGPIEILQLLQHARTNECATDLVDQPKAEGVAAGKAKGGNPGKKFKAEMAFLVGFRITELRSPDLRSVKELILEIAALRDGWSLSPDTAHGWAGEFMDWYNQRNRET